jgi:hypothetical protein
MTRLFRRHSPRPLPQPGQWTGPRPFVGREEVLAALDTALDDALQGQGQFVVLHGPDGSGRAALGRLFIARARRTHRRLRSAIGDAADPAVPAFRQLAFHFTAKRRAGAAVGRSAKHWIGALPMVGNIMAAIIETVQTLQRKQDSASAPTGSGSTIDQVRLILTFGGTDPRIILLENLERSDADELAGAFALVQRLRGTRTLFIGTSLSAGGQLPPPVRDLAREAERQGVGRLIEIPRLAPDQAAAAVELATGAPIPAPWRGWLDASAPATPTQLWDALGELQQNHLLSHVGRKWLWAEYPAELKTRRAAISSDINPVERELLTTAALCGHHFRVSQLVPLLGWSELRIADLLAPLLRRRLVALLDTVDEDDELVDIYAFESPAAAAAWAAEAPDQLRARAAELAVRAGGDPAARDAPP